MGSARVQTPVRGRLCISRFLSSTQVMTVEYSALASCRRADRAWRFASRPLAIPWPWTYSSGWVGDVYNPNQQRSAMGVTIGLSATTPMIIPHGWPQGVADVERDHSWDQQREHLDAVASMLRIGVRRPLNATGGGATAQGLGQGVALAGFLLGPPLTRLLVQLADGFAYDGVRDVPMSAASCRATKGHT